MFHGQRAFALPTTLIAGTLLFIVLSAGLVATTSIKTSLDNQYYAQLAREAAESGVIRATTCVEENDFQVTWDSDHPLRPNTDCSGAVTTSCPPSNTTASCSLVTGSTYASSYAVYVDYNATTQQMVTRAEGTVSQVRKNGVSTIYRQSFTQNALVDLGALAAEFVESGALQVCGIFDGNTWCWGTQANGRLGNGVSEDILILSPIKVSRLAGGLLGKTDKLVSVGAGNMCIVTTDNEIYCTGENSSGQVGDNTTTNRAVPTKVAKPAGMTGEVTKITASRSTFCAISAGDVWCWGSGLRGRIGNGSTSNRRIPTKTSVIGASASPSRPVTDIASDGESMHICAIAQVAGAGRAYCWGYNGRGELGDNTTTDRSVPTAVNTSGVLSGKNLVKIRASGRYPDTRINNNEFPSDAQLADIATTVSDPNRRNYARTGQTCVLDSNGKMYCWGANQYGQLGAGASHSSYSSSSPPWRQLTPVAVTTSGLDSKVITDIAVARPAACALVGSENTIYCWGRNDRGVLGRGTTIPNYSNRPDAASVIVQTPGIAGQTIDWITGGANRFCAMTTIKNVYCWGVGGTAGQIGDGTQQDRNVPTEASMLKKLRPPIIY